jgi:prevent-host-death family protein
MAKVQISAAEFQRNIGRYQDLALSRPVWVTRNGREGTVLISAEEYVRLMRRERRVGSAGELPAEWVEAVRNSSVPAEFAYLDDELK